MRAFCTVAFLLLLVTVPAVSALGAEDTDGPCFYEVEPGTGEPGVHPEDETFIPLVPYSVVRPIVDGTTTASEQTVEGTVAVLDVLAEEWFGLYVREDPQSCTGDN